MESLSKSFGSVSVAIHAIIDKNENQHEVFDQQILKHQASKEELELKFSAAKQAQEIIQRAAKETQQKLKYHISELVSIALSSIFDEPYEFDVVFEEKRGKTEARICFVRDGEEFDPMTASGGGPVDVAAFALRLVSWRLETDKSRNTIILDEPFKFLSASYQPKAAIMLHDMCERLGLQIIMVSHNADLIEAADKVFRVTKKEGTSNVSIM